ncbi:MAG: DUF6445 family protein [Parasphingopyxis sp.]|uniref:DUF6445 family protein n=1 Tax=Parasphingopyxis sp. TaxID=1920299 RepID=UPI003F9FAC72
MLPSLIVIDDFLRDPHGARRQALALDYDPAFKKGNYPGLLSTRPLAIEGLEASVSRIVGTPVKADPNTSHGHCRLTLKADKGRSGVHIDPCFYSGILYLSLDEHCRGGTDFFRHRRTGLDAVPNDPAKLAATGYADPNLLIEDVINTDTTKPGKWERISRIPMRFNRLILFKPWQFHNAGPGFGTSPETGRLVHLMFFAAAG